jgi:glycosyltransferase involved in cell wall biosynthesis
MEIIITAPSLDPTQNVSGVSSVVRFIVDNNREAQYVHFEIGKKDTEKGGITRLRSLAKAFREWRQLLGDKPDTIVHYSFPLSTRSILRDPLFIREAIKRGHRLLVHVHGGLYLTAEKIPFLQRHILQRVFAWDVPFVVLSEMEKEQVMKRFGAKNVEVLPNCVEIPENDNLNPNLNEKVTLGYLGRIEANKGMKELLMACQQLREDGVNFCLEMAGKEEHEREYLPRFEALLGNDFHYYGVVSGQSKSEFFRRMDVFVMPSYFEGLPMALLECMSYGVVPVVTPVGSIPQVMTDGKNGLLTKVKDVGSIVEAIKKLATDRALLYSMGQEARTTILNNFSTEEYIRKLNMLYERLEVRG